MYTDYFTQSRHLQPGTNQGKFANYRPLYYTWTLGHNVNVVYVQTIPELHRTMFLSFVMSAIIVNELTDTLNIS